MVYARRMDFKSTKYKGVFGPLQPNVGRKQIVEVTLLQKKNRSVNIEKDLKSRTKS